MFGQSAEYLRILCTSSDCPWQDSWAPQRLEHGNIQFIKTLNAVLAGNCNGRMGSSGVVGGELERPTNEPRLRLACIGYFVTVPRPMAHGPQRTTLASSSCWAHGQVMVRQLRASPKCRLDERNGWMSPFPRLGSARPGDKTMPTTNLLPVLITGMTWAVYLWPCSSTSSAAAQLTPPPLLPRTSIQPDNNSRRAPRQRPLSRTARNARTIRPAVPRGAATARHLSTTFPISLP